MSGHGHGFGLFPMRRVGAAWTPEELGTDIEIWVRPEDLGAPTSQVSNWPDQSGNANNLVQTTGSLKPIVVAGVIDGYKGAEVLKTGRYLVQTAAQTFNGDFEFFYIYSKTDGSTNWLPISYLGSGNHYLRDNSNEAYQCVFSGGIRYLTTPNYTPAGTTVALGSMRREGGNYQAALNGVDAGAPSTHTPGNRLCPSRSRSGRPDAGTSTGAASSFPPSFAWSMTGVTTKCSPSTLPGSTASALGSPSIASRSRMASR